MRIKHLLWCVAVTALLVASLPGTAAAGGGNRHVAVALGDSLSVGYQPNHDGPTTKGYAAVLARSRGVTLRNFGCPGETSRSLITGERSPCVYDAGSQLDAATGFLASHRGEVAYITFDIGTNDLFERCLSPSSMTFDPGCVRRSLPHVDARIERIVAALRDAAGSDVPIVSMTYYDPLLGLWLVDGGRRLARMSLRAFEALNAAFARTYRRNGVATAHVDRVFRISSFADAGGVPRNVSNTCSWTWFCSRRFFGDPHANDDGYARIARAFEHAL